MFLLACTGVTAGVMLSVAIVDGLAYARRWRKRWWER